MTTFFRNMIKINVEYKLYSLFVNLSKNTVEPCYHDSQGTEGNRSSFPGIDTSILTFNSTILAVMGVGDIR